MAINKAIHYEQLPKAAQAELFGFYDFLVQKSVRENHKRSRSRSGEKDIFFQKVASRTFSLPDGYAFDRDELHER